MIAEGRAAPARGTRGKSEPGLSAGPRSCPPPRLRRLRVTLRSPAIGTVSSPRHTRHTHQRTHTHGPVTPDAPSRHARTPAHATSHPSDSRARTPAQRLSQTLVRERRPRRVSCGRLRCRRRCRRIRVRCRCWARGARGRNEVGGCTMSAVKNRDGVGRGQGARARRQRSTRRDSAAPPPPTQPKRRPHAPGAGRTPKDGMGRVVTRHGRWTCSKWKCEL